MISGGTLDIRKGFEAQFKGGPVLLATGTRRRLPIATMPTSAATYMNGINAAGTYCRNVPTESIVRITSPIYLATHVLVLIKVC